MKKEKIIRIILAIMIVVAFEAGQLAGQIGKKNLHDNMKYLIESYQDSETNINIKVLDGLMENQNEAVIKIMQTRVKLDLKNEGIKEITIKRAKAYQDKYCVNACLGLE